MILMLFSIHSVCDEDYEDLYRLAKNYLLLNLPAKENLLKEKIKLSQRSFAGLNRKEERNFVFVMKDPQRGVIGTAQITAKAGTQDCPRYSMEIIKEKKNTILRLKVNRDGSSYLGAIVLEKSYRSHVQQLGKQLFFILFLFIAMHLDYFEDTLCADIEPWLDENRSNPFINDFICQRLNYPIGSIDDTISIDREKVFASFPREPFLLSDLSVAAQKHLGRPGFYSQRGLVLLKRQNFHIINEVDPLDGGACVMAKTRDVPIVKDAKKVFIKLLKTSDEIKAPVQQWLWGQEKESSFTGGLVKGKLADGDCLMVSREECVQRSLEFADPLWVIGW